jgi:hypothetical protein
VIGEEVIGGLAWDQNNPRFVDKLGFLLLVTAAPFCIHQYKESRLNLPL